MSARPAVLAPEEPALAGSRLPVVWALAWPVILNLTLDSLVGLADILMVGRLGAQAVAGVGIGVHVLSAVSTTMFAVGTGTLAIVARHVGAHERRDAEHVLAQSILAAFGLAAVVIVPVIAWAPALVRAFGVDPGVVATSVPYVRAVMLGVPADSVLFVVAFGLRGAGDTRTPLVIGALVAIINVAGDWSLIFGHLGLPALGAPGAGWATAAAFTAGAAAAVGLLRHGDLVLCLPRVLVPLRAGVIRRVLAIGYPAAIEHLVIQVGFLLYMAFAARYGTSAVAAYVIGVRILALSFLPGVGFSVAAGALVGQSLGARRPAEAAHGGWTATRMAFALMTASGVGIYLAARPIAELFSNDPEVVRRAVSFIHVLAAAQPLMAIDFTLAGALRGAGDTRFPLFTVLVGFYGCRLGCAWLAAFTLHLDLIWVWRALIGDYLVRSALKIARFRSDTWKRITV
jgi:putative MATE family efflux protein